MWTMRSGLEIWSDQDGPRSLTAIDVESAGAFSAFFLWMRMRRMQRWAIGSEDIKEGAIMVDGDSKGEGMDRKTEWNMNDKLEGEKTRERRRKKKKKKKERKRPQLSSSSGPWSVHTDRGPRFGPDQDGPASILILSPWLDLK